MRLAPALEFCMPAIKTGFVVALFLFGVAPTVHAQPGFGGGFPNGGAMPIGGGFPQGGFPQPPTGFSGRPVGFTGISGISGNMPPSGISGIRGVSGGMPGPRFESVWTCGNCRKEVARGNFSRPPANCPHCGVRLVNGVGPSTPNNPPKMPPMNPSPPVPSNPPINEPPPENGAPLDNEPVFTASPDTGTNVYLKGMRTTVFIMVRLGPNRGTQGSGCVVNLQDGIILTNWHVVDGANGNVLVGFPLWSNGRPVVEPDRYRGRKENFLEGTVLASDQRCDLAVIKLLDPSRIPNGTAAAQFAASSPLAGAKVYSIGNPAASDSMWVYTPGDVRNVYSKKWQAGSPDGKMSEHAAKIIEATSPVSPGDSGGPCFNDRGEQVGVAQSGLSAKVAQGYSYFIDTSEIKAFLSRNGVSYSLANGNNAVVPPPISPSPVNVPSSSPAQPLKSSSSSSTASEKSSTTSAVDRDSDSSSSSSGSGSGSTVVIVFACLIGFAAVGAIIYGATHPAKSKRPRRRMRD